jgi:hypothetical protein
MSRKTKYPHLKDLFYTDKNAYYREWRKLNPTYNAVKDEWRKLDKNLFDELPDDVISIEGFPTYYARPNGEVWRDTRGTPSAVKTGKERVLRLTPTYNAHNGYWLIQPYQNGKKKAIHLHRFILTAFKGPAPEVKMECHHIDADTSNNAISNLMWVTRQENADFVPDYKRRGPKKTLAEGRPISRSKYFYMFPEIIRLKKTGLRNVDVARQLELNEGAVHQIIRTMLKRGNI